MQNRKCWKCGKTTWINPKDKICSDCKKEKQLLKLTQLALELKDLDHSVIEAVIKGKDEDEWRELLHQFIEKRKELKAGFVDLPIVAIHNKEAREIIQSLYSDKAIFVTEKFIRNKVERDSDLFNDEELDQIASDFFYSWYSGTDYVERMLEIGPLTLGINLGREHSLNVFFSEARSCYAFENYHALYALCRTILEISVRDVCKRKRLIRNDVTDMDFYKLPKMIKKVSLGKEALRNRMDDIRENTNPLVHGRKTINSSEAIELFKKTIELIQDLYRLHNLET